MLGAPPAAAEDQLWRLDPNGERPCRCSACLRHSENKFFFSSDDAVAGRAHPGCRCVPSRVESPSFDVALAKQFSRDGRSIDRRQLSG
jgi:hypothetical protein